MSNSNWAKRVPSRNGATESIDRLPPHSPEAEMGVLGCCLLDSSCIPLCREKIRSPAVFYDHRHGEIWKALCLVGGDIVVLLDCLAQSGQLEQVGGREYVTGLQDATPSAANAGEYIKILLRNFRLRNLIRSCSEIVEEAFGFDGDESDLAEWEFVTRSRLGEVLDGERREFPSFEDASIVVLRNTPEPDRIIDHLLHVGSKLCIGGGSKSFKSWALMDLALCVSLGQPWLELPTHACPVLFINFEIPPAFFEHRLRKLATEKMLEINPDSFHVWNLRGVDAPYTSLLPELEHRLSRMANPPRFVVFDPTYKMYDQNSDENSANDSRMLLSGIERVCSRAGAAAAYSHHYSKGNQASKNSIDRISGSGVFARDPDSLLMFTGHAEEGAFTVEATLRNFAPLAPFAVRWKYPVFARDGMLDPMDLKQAPKAAGAKKKRRTEVDLLAVMPLAPERILKEELVAKRPEGMSERSAWDLIKVLLSKGSLIEHRTKRPKLRDEVTVCRPMDDVPSEQEDL